MSNVRMLLSFALAFQLAQHVVWPAAFSFGVAMSRSLPTIASALGYHSVGMKPRVILRDPCREHRRRHSIE